eukprot:TRINITY_DN15778_c0_g2_i1.p1 TRINITY_DN15778_c0_g2~~TRINITY_DN15778_c0_g2_i1.p1  ORF type:complete len:256 (-),score=21.00 TRINITY_DN15778_c0_g2_i1:259-1026(-)
MCIRDRSVSVSTESTECYTCMSPRQQEELELRWEREQRRVARCKEAYDREMDFAYGVNEEQLLHDKAASNAQGEMLMLLRTWYDADRSQLDYTLPAQCTPSVLSTPAASPSLRAASFQEPSGPAGGANNPALSITDQSSNSNTDPWTARYSSRVNKSTPSSTPHSQQEPNHSTFSHASIATHRDQTEIAPSPVLSGSRSSTHSSSSRVPVRSRVQGRTTVRARPRSPPVSVCRGDHGSSDCAYCEARRARLIRQR